MTSRSHPLQFGPFKVPVTLTLNSSDAPLALILPALGVPAAKYRLLLEELRARGYQTAVSEIPGTATSLPRPHRRADYGYNDLVFTFIPQLLQWLEEQVPGGPALIIGHSIGGQTATLAAKAGLTGNTRVISVAAGHIDFRCWPGRSRLLMLSAAILAGITANLLGYFPGRRLGFGGCEARRLMTDWSRSILSGRFAPEARIAPAAQSAQPSLHLTFKGDPFVTPSAARKLAALLGGEVRELEPTYPEGNPHLSWIRNPRPVVEEIHQWLQQKGQPPQLRADAVAANPPLHRRSPFLF